MAIGHKDWVTSELITIPKVTGTAECGKHRTISLISHAAKVTLEYYDYQNAHPVLS